MERIVAVVTCDVVRSQRYSTEQRRKIDAILKKEFATVSKAFTMSRITSLWKKAGLVR